MPGWRPVSSYWTRLGWHAFITVQQKPARDARQSPKANRGEIAVGKTADLVVFDPNSVAGPSSWESPHLLPIGIEHVAVSGRIVIEDGKPTGALPGRLLRNEGKRR